MEFKEMENLHICKFGEDILQLRAKNITNIDEKIVKLAEAMRKTMYTSNGIGLAAPQIGKSIRLAVVDISFGENPDELLVLINPEIIGAEGIEAGNEGCLSVPGITLPVNRKTSVHLKAIDLQGNEINREFEGLKARVMQHEVDHLNGTLILDRVSSLKRQFVKKEIKRLQKNGKW
jgi:peptide deformylase